MLVSPHVNYASFTIFVLSQKSLLNFAVSVSQACPPHCRVFHRLGAFFLPPVERLTCADAALGTRSTAVKKIDKNPLPHGDPILISTVAGYREIQRGVGVMERNEAEMVLGECWDDRGSSLDRVVRKDVF